MSGDAVLALAAMLIAVTAGPLRLLVRFVLRQPGNVAVRRWQHPATWGLAGGLVGAVLLAALLWGGTAAIGTAVLSLLCLLAVMDIAWRWLPFAWTLPLLALGLAAAWIQGTLPDAAIGMALGGGTLFLLQLGFRLWRGVEALGTGDIWLAAGLGALSGPDRIGLILWLAAMTALAAAILGKALACPVKRQRFGVAYGAHLCLAYPVLLLL